MVDITAIGGAMNAVKIMKDLTETMIGLRDAAAFQQKKLELQGAMIDLQSSVFLVNDERTTLIETIRKLEQQISAMETWETDKQRYEMKTVSKGTVAFSLKESMSGGQPPHWLCAHCYTNRKKGFLHLSAQPRAPSLYRDGVPWECSECPTKYVIQGGRYPEYAEKEPVDAKP